ncbi:hypothetical protein CASFOL_005119 [Castilleja foliolosa]|uniref:Vps16 N-terminal domain-containing protein n=1 Tax=Castilleja foliolosa TaxID=1961234 RepID=A0ABD3E6L5_9LAMI
MFSLLQQIRCLDYERLWCSRVLEQINPFWVLFWDCCQPLCFIGVREEELVVLVEGPRMVVYNMKEGAFKDMVVDRVPGKFVDGGTFVGSLVSPA